MVTAIATGKILMAVSSRSRTAACRRASSSTSSEAEQQVHRHQVQSEGEPVQRGEQPVGRRLDEGRTGGGQYRRERLRDVHFAPPVRWRATRSFSASGPVKEREWTCRRCRRRCPPRPPASGRRRRRRRTEVAGGVAAAAAPPKASASCAAALNRAAGDGIQARPRTSGNAPGLRRRPRCPERVAFSHR